MKRCIPKRTQKTGTATTSKAKNLQKNFIKFDRQPSKSVSCPSFKFTMTAQDCLTLRQANSVFHIREHNKFLKKFRIAPNYMDINLHQIRAASTSTTEKSASAVKNLSGVCACPCPSPNCCLPPPCNTPAKCLQYMTGYYYYPYGTWFCGPYHVSTGACPCAGPVKPGGPCGPILPCPGDPCGPPCCKPLSCCGVCGVGGPVQTNNAATAYNPWHFGSTNMYSTYNAYTQNPYADCNSFQPYNAFAPYGYCNGFNVAPPSFGPCYNVPITPIPVATPIVNEPNQASQQSSAPKSAICWPMSKANINQDTKASSKNPVGKASLQNPSPLRYPTPSYDSSPSLSKRSPYTKPRLNARTLQSSNSIGACYFSTKSMRKKYGNKSWKLMIDEQHNNIKPTKDVDKIVTEEFNKAKQPFDYSSLLSNWYTKKQM